MEGYPLNIFVIRAQLVRSCKVGHRYANYHIRIEECGRHRDPCLRRYKQFLWLHACLQRLDAGILPELPPKKLVGNKGQAFIEERRQALETYLQALLRIDAVVLNGALWAFLDADQETHAIACFLRRPSAHVDELATLADQDAGLFRLCESAVLKDLVALVLSEAAEAAVEVHAAGQGLLQGRLSNRVRLCTAVRALLRHEQARQGLADAGIFGALLQLLSRATEDREATASSSNAPLGAAESHRRACQEITLCLGGLLIATNGTVMLNFLEHSDGLSALRRLADSGFRSLHPVAASLLWYGLRNDDVVSALASAQTRGLPLFEKLLKSEDVQANLFAALGLCRICTVITSPDSRYSYLHALKQNPLTAKLDAAEELAMSKVVDASIRLADETALNVQELPVPKNHAPSEASAASRTLSCERSPTLVKTLRILCSAEELPRLAGLLGAENAEPDAATLTVVSIFDHFVRQCVDEKMEDRVTELRSVAPRLQYLANMENEDSCNRSWSVTNSFFLCRETEESEFRPRLRFLSRNEAGSDLRSAVEVLTRGQISSVDRRCSAVAVFCESQHGFFVLYRAGTRAVALRQVGFPPEDVQVRAARVLVHLKWPWPVSTSSGSSSSGRDGTEVGPSPRNKDQALEKPPSLEEVRQHATVLEVMAQHSKACQESAKKWLDERHEHCRRQYRQVQSGGLAQAPCLDEKRLDEFIARVGNLQARRMALCREETKAKQAVDDIDARLTLRGVSCERLSSDVKTFCNSIQGRFDEYDRVSAVAKEELVHAEARHRKATANLEGCTEDVRKLQELARAKADDAESAAREASARDKAHTEAATAYHTFPKRVSHLKGKLGEAEHKSAELKAASAELETTALGLQSPHAELTVLQEGVDEVEDALRALVAVSKDFEQFSAGENDTQVAAEPLATSQVQELQSLKSRLLPKLPQRLRRAPSIVSSLSASRSTEKPVSDDTNPFNPASTNPFDAADPKVERTDSLEPPVWDDFAEQDFYKTASLSSFKQLLKERERLWRAEGAWLQVCIVAQDNDARRLKKQQEQFAALLYASRATEQRLRTDIADLGSSEQQEVILRRADEAAAAAQEVAHIATREVGAAEEARKAAERRLEQVRDEVRDAEVVLVKARTAVETNATDAESTRQTLASDVFKLEDRARVEIEEWRAVELDELRLDMLQNGVASRLVEEADGRKELRIEARKLIEELESLDRQLLVGGNQAASSSDSAVTPRSELPCTPPRRLMECKAPSSRAAPLTSPASPELSRTS